MTLSFTEYKYDKRHLLEPEYADAYQAYRKDSTPASRLQLIDQTKPIIDTALTTFAPGQPELRTQARIMAAQSLDTYDPSRGSLRTHMLSNLQGLQRYAAQSSQIIRIPERVAIDRQRLFETEESLYDTLGRPPSTAEIADATGLSPKRIAHIRRATPATNSGKFVDEFGNTSLPASTIPGDSRLESAAIRSVYEDLSPINRLIMEHTLGLYGSEVLSGGQLAKKLRLSPGAISQRKAMIERIIDRESDALRGEL